MNEQPPQLHVHVEKESTKPAGSRPGFLIFALMVVIAPLLFGAADRIVQVGLTGLLAVGMILAPPRVPKPRPFARIFIGLFVVILLVKEFAPFAWFGGTTWHSFLTESFGVTLSATHNPEPARALDALLVAAVACIWFLWVRGLAQSGSDRNLLAWILFASAASLALVCLTMKNDAPSYIYGVRYTPGWMGFGPFPNKNHTASFLAMGALIGCACISRAGSHRKYPLVGLGAILISLILIALFQSKSRGGLIAFVLGLGIFALLAMLKIRNTKTVVAAVSAFLVAAGLLMAFGSQLLTRFSLANEGDIPSNIRWSVWSDTLNMWRDARLLGHGLDTFPQLFPIYQQITLENRVVLHPESSWLQWLVELGAVPLLMLSGVLVYFVAGSARELFAKRHGFLIRAGALAAVAALLTHAAWDVPAHRWATAGFGLALLAVACPLRHGNEAVKLGRGTAMLPLIIAIFWSLPFFLKWPAWSPSSLALELEKVSTTAVSVEELETAERFFPLSADLQHAIGMRLLNERTRWPDAWSHFRVADRLKPCSWSLPAMQAQAAKPFSSGMELHYWTLAVERAGPRDELVFIRAFRDTANLPVAESHWGRFVDNNPHFCLTLADQLPDKAGDYYFSQWWQKRATQPDLRPYEVKHFYDLAWRYGKKDELCQWIERHPELEARDFRIWAKVLHELGDDAQAWKILSHQIGEPVFPQSDATVAHEVMESTWLLDPKNTLNAQNLAAAWLREGQPEKSRKLIIAVASQADSPVWFLRKAAYLLAAENKYGDAVASLLREK